MFFSIYYSQLSSSLWAISSGGYVRTLLLKIGVPGRRLASGDWRKPPKITPSFTPGLVLEGRRPSMLATIIAGRYTASGAGTGAVP
jgi:hypothetical protein